MVYQETLVQRNQHRIYVRDYAGDEPPIILMHGFPDNLHLYDRLIPCLSPPRRVIAFDFLGWGASDKPTDYPYTASSQVGDLDAVIAQMRLGQVILVAHDASGVADVWSLDLPSHVSLAGREILQRRRRQKSVPATAVSTVRCDAKRPSRLLSVE
jgi:haloalkane dehalogenase